MTEQKIPVKVIREIESAIKIRHRAKLLDTEAKELTTQAKNTLLPLLTAYNLKQYVLEGVGKVMTKVNAGSRINEDKLKGELLNAGLEPADINDIIERSTKSWSSEFIDFRLV